MAKALKQIGRINDKRIACAVVMIAMIAVAIAPSSEATTGWVQIVTPDLQPKDQLSLSVQFQNEKLGNVYQLQAEMGLTDWADLPAVLLVGAHSTEEAPC